MNINPTVRARWRRCFPRAGSGRNDKGRTKRRRKGKFFFPCWANRKPTATVGSCREKTRFLAVLFSVVSLSSPPLPLSFGDFNAPATSTARAVPSRGPITRRVLTKILADDFVPHPHLKFHRSSWLARGRTRLQQRDASTLHRMQLRRVMIS